MNVTLSVGLAALAAFALSSVWYTAMTPVEARVLGPAAPPRGGRPSPAKGLLELARSVLVAAVFAGGRAPRPPAQRRRGGPARPGAVGRVSVRAAERLGHLGQGAAGHGRAARGRLAAQAGRDLSDRGAVAVSARRAYERDPRVDDYIKPLPAWQQELCRQLRDLIHASDPEIAETIKRTVQPYFVLEGNVCALLAAKDHVNLFLYDRAAVPDPEGIITGGHNNKAARMISFYEGDTINAPALTTMLKHIIANNRAGRTQ